jgi:Fic family protein
MVFENAPRLKAIAAKLADAGPGGMSPQALEQAFAPASRSTINRRLAALVRDGAIKLTGSGRAIRYWSVSPFTLDDIAAYFVTDWRERPLVSYSEQSLLPEPNISAEKATRLRQLHALAGKMDQKFLASFLIDLSWGSSVLEGSTYSALDTQALLEYGQRNKDKPTEDAVLILNHKRAIEHLWAHRELSVENLCAMHAMLTDDHNLAEVAASDHFLPAHQRGVPREYEDVNLGRSAYLPPFRPGTGYVKQALHTIVETARHLEPVQAALYLLTRIPYLQAFANGNKRSARLAANLPLLGSGLMPFSFVDIDKAEYIRGMAAFYELGNIQAIEHTFVHGYVRSIVRGSTIPPNMRTGGFSIAAVADLLVDYVNTGNYPKDAQAAGFVGKG